MAKVAVRPLETLSNCALTWQGQGDSNRRVESNASLSNDAAIGRNIPEGGRGTLANCDDLYFIRMGDGPVKIGRTRNLKSRLKMLQCGSPYPLTVMGVLKDQGDSEGCWHGRFFNQRLVGEWFEWSDDLQGAISEALDSGNWHKALGIKTWREVLGLVEPSDV